MKNLTSNLMITAGMLLMFSAAALGVYNVREDRSSGVAAGEILNRLKAEITIIPDEEPEQPPENDLFAPYETEPVWEEREIDIDANKYIGIISIPALELELPVMSKWSSSNLKLAPCRYQGSAADSDLIIAGHNYRSHFGPISRLNSGDLIEFIEANGRVHTYELLHTEILNGYDIAGMNAGAGEDWNLTLYTCTLGGQSRVTVRAVEILPE